MKSQENKYKKRMWNEKWKIIDLSGGFFLCKKKEKERKFSMFMSWSTRNMYML